MAFVLAGCGAQAGTSETVSKLMLTPQQSIVALNHSQQFSVTDNGGHPVSVLWNVSGMGCTSATCGTVDSRGVFKAPTKLPNPPLITLEAVLLADSNHSLITQVQLTQSVTVTVNPSSAQVATGATQQFTAIVTGAGNPVVTWSLSGPGCSGLSCGMISGSGLYTAPTNVPNPATVNVKATALADPSASGSATVTLIPPAPIHVAVSPTEASLGPGVQQQFTATVTGTRDTGVTWNVSGAGCVGYTCGTITLNGLYTAPPAIPNPPTVSVTAYSHADPSKSATAVVTLGTPVVVSVSPGSAQVLPGKQQQFSATVTGTKNSAVTWSLKGAGCTGTACGAITQTGLYTAPLSTPTPPSVTVVVTSQADATKFGTAAVNLVTSVAVTVSPGSVHVSPGARQQFSAVVSGSSNQVVVWGLSGTGCTGLACGQITGTGLYTAPTNIPNPNVVTATATSVAFPTVSGTATIYVGAGSPVVVTLSPASANVVVGQSQQFTAQVTGTTNKAVNWSLSGSGCVGDACGTLSGTGLYTAPSSAPTPPSVTIVATSQADPTRYATAVVNVLPNVVVTVDPKSANVTTGAQQQFTATVTGSSNRSVNWSLSGSGCGGASCGTITSSGMYTAPSQVPNPAQVSVIATAQADPSKSALATVTVLAPIKVTVAPQNAQVVVRTQQQFVATVTGTSNKTVLWNLSGRSCPDACGAIDSNGLYTAPVTIPGSTVTVTATSQANGTSAGTATIQVIARNESKLNGQYTFLLRGNDAGGFYQAAGSFTADGLGNVANGIEDVNKLTGPATAVSFTGTYTVKGDNRGTLTIASSLGTFTYAFALTANNNLARMIEVDRTGVRTTGTLKRQNPSAFSNSALSGGYTFSLTGIDSSTGRIGVLSSIFPTGSGVIAGSSMDVNDAGSNLPTFVSFNGNYDVSSNGRGTLSLNVPGFAGGKFSFVIYVISAGEFTLTSIDPLSSLTPMFSGTALLQSGAPFSSASLNGNGILYVTGITTSAPDVSIGLASFDGHSSMSMQLDENSGGVLQIGTPFTGAYSVSLNGRTTLNLVNSQTHQTSTSTIYVVAPNTAFVMDMSLGVRSGFMEPQVVGPPFGNSTLVGNFTFASTATVGTGAPFSSGTANFDGNGIVTGNEDEDLLAGPSLNEILSGTYSVSPSSKNGRGAILLTLPQPQTIAIWVTSYSKAYGIPVDSSDTQPTVLIFEQ